MTCSKNFAQPWPSWTWDTHSGAESRAGHGDDTQISPCPGTGSSHPGHRRWSQNPSWEDLAQIDLVDLPKCGFLYH